MRHLLLLYVYRPSLEYGSEIWDCNNFDLDFSGHEKYLINAEGAIDHWVNSLNGICMAIVMRELDTCR